MLLRDATAIGEAKDQLRTMAASQIFKLVNQRRDKAEAALAKCGGNAGAPSAVMAASVTPAKTEEGAKEAAITAAVLQVALPLIQSLTLALRRPSPRRCCRWRCP